MLHKTPAVKRFVRQSRPTYGAGSPAARAKAFNAALVQIAEGEDFKRRLADVSAVPVGSTARELGSEIAKWQPIVEQTGLANQ